VLSGAVSPSGRLPVSLPRFGRRAQPFSYLHPILGGNSDVTSADSAPVRPFGFGLGYTTFTRTDLSAPAEVDAGGVLPVSVTVTNTGSRAGTEIVQLYAHDVHASVVRPVAQLLGYARVTLEAGERAVHFEVPTARLAFTDRGGIRIVEPGRVDLWVGESVADRETVATVTSPATCTRSRPPMPASWGHTSSSGLSPLPPLDQTARPFPGRAVLPRAQTRASSTVANVRGQVEAQDAVIQRRREGHGRTVSGASGVLCAAASGPVSTARARAWHPDRGGRPRRGAPRRRRRA
jgi:hypothetical protein